MRIPDPVVRQHGALVVVRDDTFPGGTKRAALQGYVQTGNEYVYAGPASGYAQVALAYACRDAGARATVFVARRGIPHRHTREAEYVGAQVVQVPFGYLSHVQSDARKYAEQRGAVLVPFGFDIPELRAAITVRALATGLQPPEVWSVAGSGVLTRSLQDAWPTANFMAVRIGREPHIGRAVQYNAPESFEQNAKVPPPFPSCANYDAKAWRFIQQHASPGALFWNVAA